MLVAREGRLGFRHALLRAAAYDDLSEPRRAELHDQLAAALQGAGLAPDAEIGRHLRLAGRDEVAVVHLERAGIEARRVGALAEAAAFLAEALEIRPGDPQLLLELGDVEAWRSRWEAADAAFAQALRGLAPDDAEGRARTHARRGLWFRTSLCAPERSAASYREALALLEPLAEPPQELLIDVLAGLAWAEGAGGDPDAADALLVRVHQLSGGYLPDATAATVNFARGMALCRRGRFAESYGPMLAAADAHVRAGAVDEACVALSNAGCAAAFERDFDRALEYADRAVPLGGAAVGLQLHAQAARAYVLSRLGRHDEARAAAAAQCARAARSGTASLLASARHDLGQIALAAGDDAAAAELLGQALDARRAGPAGARAAGAGRGARAAAAHRRGRGGAARRHARAGGGRRLPGDARAAPGSRTGVDRGRTRRPRARRGAPARGRSGVAAPARRGRARRVPGRHGPPAGRRPGRARPRARADRARAGRPGHRPRLTMPTFEDAATTTAAAGGGVEGAL